MQPISAAKADSVMLASRWRWQGRTVLAALPHGLHSGCRLRAAPALPPCVAVPAAASMAHERLLMPASSSVLAKSAANNRSARLGGRDRSLLTPNRAAADASIALNGDGDAPKTDMAKIGALACMFLCSCFIYTLLSNMKDSLIVTTIGAEVLPFLGSWAVLPGSILFYMYYSKMNAVLSQKYVYYAALLPFISFYLLFSAVLYPSASVLHPQHLLEPLKAALPDGLVGLAGMVINWSYSLFYVVAELWGAAAISMLFWGIADDVCSMQEAKDWFPILGMIANVGLIFAGGWMKFVNATLSGGDAVRSFQWLSVSIVGVAAVLFGTKAWVDKHYMDIHHANADAALKVWA